MNIQLLTYAGEVTDWQQTLYASLAEKHRRLELCRTVESYARMLQHFFGFLGKQPNEVTSRDVFSYDHNTGLSGKHPSAITIGSRIACISSFYRFLIWMK
jgi:site-specific recombinase XerD